MARSITTKKAALRSLAVLLALTVGLAVLAGGLFQWAGGQLTPRLGLDLEGGTEMVLAPVIEDGSAVNPGQLDRAVEIIRQRIDANGVAESEISTQGGRNIVVAIPGTPSEEQLDAIRKPSQLRFRAVFVQDFERAAPQAGPEGTPSGTATTGTSTGTATTTGTPTPSASTTAASGVIPEALRAATTAPTTSATGSPSSTATTPASTETPAAPTGAELEAAIAAQTSRGLLTLGWEQAKADQAAAKVAKEYVGLNCLQPGSVDRATDLKDAPMATCGEDGVSKYVLGPVEIDGSEIGDATSGYQPGPTGQPTSIVEVRLSFKDSGRATFAEVTKRLVGLQGQPPLDQFAVVLDKRVITAPQAKAVISDGRASITGSFTIDSAQRLAEQLKFGALPMSFALQTNDTITPQLGEEQLRLGLLAGLIGLILVVVYSMFQYRALGTVTVISLVVATTLTYLALVVLGTTHGFRLTMAGVTGAIVAIGVTADSFIVYFERIRDEVREGRPLVAAVETGWKRARRTIIAADAVNLLAAVVLYVLASANVRGFAFTLGLTTLIDLAVVVLFTHPMVQLLAHTEFFGNGHKWSGLDPERLGAKESPRYRGRGQFRPASAPTVTRATPLAEGKAHS